MKAETLFNAYQKTTRRKRRYSHLRQKEIVFGNAQRGIAIHEDRWARKWQKADRQARKFEAALRRKLQEAEETKKNYEKAIQLLRLVQFGASTMQKSPKFVFMRKAIRDDIDTFFKEIKSHDEA